MDGPEPAKDSWCGIGATSTRWLATTRSAGALPDPSIIPSPSTPSRPPAATSPSSSATTCTVGSGMTESPGNAYGCEKWRGRCDV